MNINIKGTKVALSTSDKQFIEEKLSGLAKFLKSEDKIHVEIEVNKKHKTGLVCRAEITIHPHGIYAESEGVDFYSALDLVIPKIKEQLVKAKEKRISLRKQRRG